MKKYLRDFLLAILAGFSIGLGGTVYLRLKDAFTGGNVVGGVFFPVVEKICRKLSEDNK
ncbi:MAG: hypothetical protein LUH18_02315 [Oscillospiraceae bacterium]|nr:hypothetical protein [Oscillospiraceae bacterium]